MKKSALNLLLLVTLHIATAQTTFETIFSFGSPFAIGLVPLPDSGTLTCLNLVYLSPDTQAVEVFRYNKFGQKIWGKAFYPAQTTRGAIKLHDGYLLHLESTAYDSTVSAFITVNYLVKFNDAGDTLWTRKYKRGGRIFINNLREVNDTTIMALGYYVPSTSGYDGFTFCMLLNEKGDVKRFRVYNVAGGGTVISGGYEIMNRNFIIGRPYPGVLPVYSTLLKIADDGTPVWSRKYSFTDWAPGGVMTTIDSHGDIFVTGSFIKDTVINGSHNSRYGVALLKLDNMGVPVYYKLIRNDFVLQYLGIAAEDTGVGYVFPATVEHTVTSPDSGVIIRTDYDGNILSSNKGLSVFFPSSCRTATDGTYFITSNGNGPRTWKINENLTTGCLPPVPDLTLAVELPAFAADTFAFTVTDSAMLALPSGLGFINSIHNANRLCIDSGLLTGSGEQTSDVNKLEVAPNPAADYTQLSFTLEEAGNARLKIFDVNGKEVLNFYYGFVEKGLQHRITLNTRELPDGLYFVHLCSEKSFAVNKLMVAR